MSSNLSVQSRSSYLDYGRFASGKKIQKASDGAAELAIIQKLNTQARGYSAGSKNIGAAQSLTNIADGAMSGVTDYLQRIYELGVRASNSFLSNSDRAGIQTEIDLLKQGISQAASNVNYNQKNLLDGSNPSMAIASGSGQMYVTTSNTTLDALGIADFNVTGDFDLKQIEDALAKVSAGRSKIGAQSNALEHAYRYNANASYNTIGSQSRLEDLDYPKAISEQKKKETLQQYSFFMQKRRMQDEANRMQLFFIS